MILPVFQRDTAPSAWLQREDDMERSRVNKQRERETMALRSGDPLLAFQYLRKLFPPALEHMSVILSPWKVFYTLFCPVNIYSISEISAYVWSTQEKIIYLLCARVHA